MSENGNSVSTERGGVGGEVAVLAGGCFWGVEDILRKVPGVLDTDVGYTGGWLENPTYHDTHGSKSGHAEAYHQDYLRKNPGGYTCHYMRA
jgi:peptide methionine sulfoxide reductase MsrA